MQAVDGVREEIVMSQEQDDEDVKQNKVKAVLSYFGILVLIPMLTARDSKFARFHAGQGVNLLVVSMIYGFITAGVTAVFKMVVESPSFLYLGLAIIINLGRLAILYLMVRGIINACKGKMKELPYIGHFKLFDRN